MGRRVTAVVATTLTAMLIANAGRSVYAEVFAVPETVAQESCGEGIRRLHPVFLQVWATRQRGEATAPVPPAAERDFQALRRVCEAEGPEAVTAYTHFSRWRHRAESLTRLWSDALHSDAERALGYVQPQRPSP